VAFVAAFLQFFYYCRSALTTAQRTDISDHVLDVAGMQGGVPAADDFDRFLQLVRLCPEHAADRTEIRAVVAYRNLLRLVGSVSQSLAPALAAWAERERQQCSHFAAVMLDRSIASSREMFVHRATSDRP
jgi:hypothetical protein